MVSNHTHIDPHDLYEGRMSYAPPVRPITPGTLLSCASRGSLVRDILGVVWRTMTGEIRRNLRCVEQG